MTRWAGPGCSTQCGEVHKYNICNCVLSCELLAAIFQYSFLMANELISITHAVKSDSWNPDWQGHANAIFEGIMPLSTVSTTLCCADLDVRRPGASYTIIIRLLTVRCQRCPGPGSSCRPGHRPGTGLLGQPPSAAESIIQILFIVHTAFCSRKWRQITGDR